MMRTPRCPRPPSAAGAGASRAVAAVAPNAAAPDALNPPMPRASVIAFVGLGANLGDARRRAVQQALIDLARLPHSELLAASRLYRSAPVDAAGPDYVNAVAELRTSLSAPALLAALQALRPPGASDYVSPRPAHAGFGPAAVRQRPRQPGADRSAPAHGAARLRAAPAGRAGARAGEHGAMAGGGRSILRAARCGARA